MISRVFSMIKKIATKIQEKKKLEKSEQDFRLVEKLYTNGGGETS